MKTIKFESYWGNFAYRMTAEVPWTTPITPEEDALLEKAFQGWMANECYRTAGSGVDKALGVKKGDGRKSVLFSDADGERINAAVSAKLTEMETKGQVPKGMFSFQVIGEHVYGVVETGTKEATAIWEKWQEVDATKDRPTQEAQFAAQLKKIGLTTEDYDDDRAVAAIAKLLRDARKAAADSAKAELAKIGV